MCNIFPAMQTDDVLIITSIINAKLIIKSTPFILLLSFVLTY